MASGSDGVWGPIDKGLQDFETGIRNARAREVNSQALRELARQVVRDFFRAVRPQLAGAQISTLDAIDERFQLLLQLANKRSLRVAYLALLRTMNAMRPQVEIDYERRTAVAAMPATFALATVEVAITQGLSKALPAAVAGYQQAIRDLQAGDRLSWRGTAAELREVGRETLDSVAPDADVMAAPGFKLERDQTGPTQKQKMRHIMRTRHVPEGAERVPEDLLTLIETTASFARSTYTRGSTDTHKSPTRAEVRQLKRYVDTLLCELLQVDV